jgi:hypothetical protein
MKVVDMRTKGTWREVADAARTTVGMEKGEREPSSSWKKKMLLAEHSPIRKLLFCWKWVDLPYWCSVHLVRHKIGIEHWIKSQRSDRTGIPREELPQGALVTHECEANAQALITISRKRLCRQASPETRLAWTAVVAAVKSVDEAVASVCVPDCIYRGGCYEMKPCRWNETDDYNRLLEKYQLR